MAAIKSLSHCYSNEQGYNKWEPNPEELKS